MDRAAEPEEEEGGLLDVSLVAGGPRAREEAGNGGVLTALLGWCCLLFLQARPGSARGRAVRADADGAHVLAVQAVAAAGRA